MQPGTCNGSALGAGEVEGRYVSVIERALDPQLADIPVGCWAVKTRGASLWNIVKAAVILFALVSLVPDNAEARARPRSTGDLVSLGGRPESCPSRYCGCALKLFLGIPDPTGYLNVAYNWLRKFPRVEPRPGAVAARRGHVMQLVEHVGGDKWIVRDYNSGHGQSRIHVRSIRGFTTVLATNYRAELLNWGHT